MKNKILELNRKLLISIGEQYPIGLVDGKMGVCIYYYHLYRFEKDDNCKILADRLLDDIINDLSLNMQIDVENGLAGIAIGITYLINENFIEGDVNEVLHNIDSVIYKKISFEEISSIYTKAELMHLLIYFYVRFVNLDDDDDRYIFNGLIVNVLNELSEDMELDFFDEPLAFSIYNYHLPILLRIMTNLFSLGFYNYKIVKILGGLAPIILSRFPILNSNRLFLLWGILSITPCLQSSVWDKYAKLLRENIDVNEIINSEMKNKNIFIGNGLSAIYLLLHSINTNSPQYEFNFSAQIIHTKILKSDAWDAMLHQNYYYNMHKGLFNGFLGVHLVSHLINKHSL